MQHISAFVALALSHNKSATDTKNQAQEILPQ